MSSPATARYREYAPSAALKTSVRAIFTFAVGGQLDSGLPTHGQPRHTLEITRRRGDPSWSNLFADAHVSLVCCVGGAYSIEGLWYPARPLSHVIGPMCRSHETIPGTALTQVGAYFTASGVRDFIDIPVHELTDRVVALEDLWGAAAIRLEERLGEITNDQERVAVLQDVLLRTLKSRRRSQIGFDLGQLAACAEREPGTLSVTAMADLAGVSRQYLSRTFQEQVGLSPNGYTSTLNWNDLLQLGSVTGPNNATSIFGYDASGNLAS
jgi:AraC-like DNA-binding protein